MGEGWDNPLRARLDAAGAVWGEVALALGEGTYAAAQHFGDAVAEYARTQREVALLDLSARETLALTGQDRARWLHGLCTQQIKKLEPLQGAYACHINIKGRLLADLWVANVGSMLVLDVEPGAGRGLRRMLRGFKVSEDVKLWERSELFASVGLVGPRAAALLASELGEEVAGLRPGHLILGELFGVECMIVATPQFGPPGFRVAALREQLGEVWDGLRALGAAPAGFVAQEKARLRAGRPRFGPDLGEELLFNEADLADAVSFTKGCYLGQEIVERVDARGNVGRRLLALSFEDQERRVPAAGSILRNQDRELGSVTSAAYLDDLERVVALAIIHRSDNAAGTVVEVVEPDGLARRAVVTERSAIGASS